MDNIRVIFERLKRNPKQMLIVISAAVAVALLVYFAFILKPQVIKISGIMGRLNKARADLKTAESDIAGIGSMNNAVEAFNKKIGKYEKTLPIEEGIPGLLESLSEMARKANMRIAGIVPVGTKELKAEKRVYKEIPIMINAKAGYHELGRFLTSLENSDRFIKVADIHIKSSAATPLKHDVELLVVTYVLLEGK